MSDDGKIVAFPKKPVAEDSFRIKPAENPNADAVLIATLEDALDRAKKGEITGCAMISWYPDGPGFLRWLSMPVHEKNIDVAAFRFMGGLSLLEADLKCMAHERYLTFEESATPVHEGEPS